MIFLLGTQIAISEWCATEHYRPSTYAPPSVLTTKTRTGRDPFRWRRDQVMINGSRIGGIQSSRCGWAVTLVFQNISGTNSHVIHFGVCITFFSTPNSILGLNYTWDHLDILLKTTHSRLRYILQRVSRKTCIYGAFPSRLEERSLISEYVLMWSIAGAYTVDSAELLGILDGSLRLKQSSTTNIESESKSQRKEKLRPQ